jgi:hypothetical protein
MMMLEAKIVAVRTIFSMRFSAIMALLPFLAATLLVRPGLPLI